MNINVVIPHVKIRYNKYNQVFSSCKKCSFDVVATNFTKYYNKYVAGDRDDYKLQVTYKPSPDIVMVVADMWLTLEVYTSWFLSPYAIYWLDTAWITSDRKPQGITRSLTIVTTSKWNSQILTSLGIKNYIVPRAVDDDLADTVFEKVRQSPTQYKYDFFFLATSAKDNHKNEQLVYQVLRDLNELSKTYKVCDYEWCDAKPFSLSDAQKYEIMSQSRIIIWLSESEGFGLPPTEAMSVGVPVIHFDSQYVNAPFDGVGSNSITHFKIPVYGYKLRRSPTVPEKYFPSPMYDYNDVIRVFKEALSYTKENEKDAVFEYRYRLHEYVKYNFYHRVIIDKLLKLDIAKVVM